MGVYIYSLRMNRSVKTPMGKVYYYKYRSKLTGWEGSYRQQQAMDRWADNFHQASDVLVAIEGGDGSSVYRQDQAEPFWFDCDRVYGEFVGVLRKKGRGYVISTLDDEYERSVDELGRFAQEVGLIPKGHQAEIEWMRSVLGDSTMDPMAVAGINYLARKSPVCKAYAEGHGAIEADRVTFFRNLDGMCRRHIYANYKTHGYLNLDNPDIKRVFNIIQASEATLSRLVEQENRAAA